MGKIVAQRHRESQAGEYDRAAFDAFARSLGAVPGPIPNKGHVQYPANGSSGKRQGKGLSPEYRQMVRDAKAFFGDEVRERLTEMLVPYRVADTHDLTPHECAEISEKIEILQVLRRSREQIRDCDGV